MSRPDFAREVRIALRDPAKLCAGLGLLKGHTRQARGLMICCPVHGDRTPSCSVTTGRDGTVAVRCFACVADTELLLTASGFRLAGDGNTKRVFAHTGEPTSILERSSQQKELVAVTTTSDREGIRVTPDHRMLWVSAPVSKHSLERLRWDGELREALASDLPKDAWIPFVIPCQQRTSWRIAIEGPAIWKGVKRPREVDGYDAELCWAIGLYSAEGSISGNRLVTFTVHRDEATALADRLQRVAEMFGARAATHRKSGNGASITVSSVAFAKLLDRIVGRGCDKKVCPPEILFGPVSAAASWLTGLYDGDGSKTLGRRILGLTSRHLTYAAYVVGARCHALPRMQRSYKLENRKRIWKVNFAGGSWTRVEKAAAGAPELRQLLRKSESVVRLKGGAWALVSRLRAVRPAGSGRVVDLATTDRTFTLATATVHNCDFSGDALTLVAVAHGLDLRANFVEVLAAGAGIAGLHAVVDALRGNGPAVDYQPLPAPPPAPPKPYPPAGEVEALWNQAGPVSDDPMATGMLVARRIDPCEVTERNLARVIQAGAEMPRWARYGRRTWEETGHRLILRVFAPSGELTSVRAWRVIEGETPKRLPPLDHKAAGLVLANRGAVGMLLRKTKPRRLVIVEGEPDFLTASLRFDCAVIGVQSGAWSQEFAARVPNGCEVIVFTHADAQGERYAAFVRETLGERCEVWRQA